MPLKLKYFLFLFCTTTVFCALTACNSPSSLPILGERYAQVRTQNGKQVVDTVYFSVPDFEFTNQDSAKVTNRTFENKIYVADFFFTACPTICPVIKKNLLRVQAAYKADYRLGILSHSVDTRHDSIPVLKKYSQKLHADIKQWHFVTGDKLKIYDIAANGYYSVARPDSTAPGGYLHSGYLILVDKKRHIRGLYDGTNTEETDKLIGDIATLLQEK